jgi:hypothetical protein
MCPTLRGNRISRSEKLNEERDTIPKPVGLGMQLQNHNANGHRTESNTIRGCSRSFRELSDEACRDRQKPRRCLRQFSISTLA